MILHRDVHPIGNIDGMDPDEFFISVSTDDYLEREGSYKSVESWTYSWVNKTKRVLL